MDWTVRSESVPLGDLLVRSALRTPEAVALAFPEESFTFRDLLERSVGVARGLLAIGAKAGDNVGLLAPNSPEYVGGLFGAALIGAVAVPLSVRSTSSELEYLVNHARLVAVLTTDRVEERADFRRRLGEALPGLADADGDAGLSLGSAPLLQRVIMLRGNGGGGCMGQEQFDAAAADVPSDAVAVTRARVRIRAAALILYTSGTTSNPKGCVISHEAITRGSMGRIDEAFPFSGAEAPTVMWCPAPLFHIAALQGFLYTIGTGGTFVTDVYLDAERALASIKEWRCTTIWSMFMPPLRTLRTASGFRPAELGFVGSIMTVGPESELYEWQAMFPQATLINGAGMSETAGWFCMSSREDSAAMRATSAGKPIAGAQMRTVDPVTGEDVPDGVQGELLVRTYTMLDAYFRDPQRTSAAIDADGWLHTGDLFTGLPSGHFVYSGRLKDMLKVGGENVPAIEVESFLCSHPSVLTAEVVGIADPVLDEVPVAFVELRREASASEEEIIEYCRGRLASFKIPRAVHFMAPGTWPVSATKVNKGALRSEAARLAAGGPSFST